MGLFLSASLAAAHSAWARVRVGEGCWVRACHVTPWIAASVCLPCFSSTNAGASFPKKMLSSWPFAPGLLRFPSFTLFSWCLQTLGL